MFIRFAIPLIQVVLGASGIAACAASFVLYAPRLEHALTQLDQVAGEAVRQADVSDELVSEWSVLLKGFDKTLSAHRQTLESMQTSSRQVGQSVHHWRSSMLGFSRNAKDASQVFQKFSEQLPLKIPNVELKTRQIDFEVPDITLQNRTVRLPYPTASVGSRKVELDLGLTDLKLDVPTLTIGSKDRILNVPISPDVKKRIESVTVPADVNLVYRKVLVEEKSVLQSTAAQLARASENLQASSQALGSVEQLLNRELMASIELSQSSLRQSQQSLQHSYQVELPDLKQRLQRGAEALSGSRNSFRNLKGMIPISFVMLGLIPLGVLLSGVHSWIIARRSSPSLPT